MASINAPMSIADVVAQAGNYTYNAQIPLASWLRTASTMQKEVRMRVHYRYPGSQCSGASLRSGRKRPTNIPATIPTRRSSSSEATNSSRPEPAPEQKGAPCSDHHSLQRSEEARDNRTTDQEETRRVPGAKEKATRFSESTRGEWRQEPATRA